ncbi:MAG: S-adenosylmethionine:tRNA ribosyltransferase-isomerase [Myxococcota bacterium]
MNPWPAADAPRGPEHQRLLAVDAHDGSVFETRARQLPNLLCPGDLVVLNDAATLPASLRVRSPHDRDHELRIAIAGGPQGWWGVLMGEGDWRTPTEDRPAPDVLPIGARLTLPTGDHARIAAVSPLGSRLVQLDWGRPDAEVLALLYAHARPIQYSYTRRDLELSDVQTPFGVRPWAVEMPSASRPLDWATLGRLRSRGVELATLTHAAGLSATGDDALDARLPLPERYELPSSTVEAIGRARAGGGRVLAVGTTVVRALEGNAQTHDGQLVPGPGITDLVIAEGFRPQIVDGLLSGVHEPGTSHHQVVSAFAPAAAIEAADDAIARSGLLIHEFGDATLLLPRVASQRCIAA